MPSLKVLIQELEEELNNLNDKFLNHWFPVNPIEHTPDKFQYDIKSYCVLAHAAFEEFIEVISMEISNSIASAWKNKKLSQAVISFAMFYPQCKVITEDNEDEPQERLFDQVRNGLDKGLVLHSKAIFNNHGFSLKYLRLMLTPVGIDVPTDPKYINSLKELAGARGSYAHSKASNAAISKASRPMTPDIARSIVQDCFELCFEIKKLSDIELNQMNKNSTEKPELSIRSKLLRLKNKNRNG